MAPSFTETDDDPRYVVPTIDPKDFDDFAVFRETFLRQIDHVREVSAFRDFATVLFEMSGEATRLWQGTYAESTASDLAASVADLRYLQGFLSVLVTTSSESESLTPRNKFFLRTADRTAQKIAALAEEIEADLRAGLGEFDE